MLKERSVLLNGSSSSSSRFAFAYIVVWANVAKHRRPDQREASPGHDLSLRILLRETRADKVRLEKNFTMCRLNISPRKIKKLQCSMSSYLFALYSSTYTLRPMSSSVPALWHLWFRLRDVCRAVRFGFFAALQYKYIKSSIYRIWLYIVVGNLYAISKGRRQWTRTSQFHWSSTMVTPDDARLVFMMLFQGWAQGRSMKGIFLCKLS